MSGTNLVNANLLQRLEQLSVAAKSRIRGTMQGKRRSRGMGSSLDFADYRLYSPGDDIRQLDWNAYGRTGKPFIKLFLDEQELQVHVWVDASKSMDFGGPSQDFDTPLNKFAYARQLAACIGYIALNRYDRLNAAAFTDAVTGKLPPLRGKGSAPRLFDFWSAAVPGGQGDIGAVFRHPANLPKLPGMTWLLSDFLYSSGVEEALTYLLAARQEVVVLHILSPEEVDPSLSGELKLIDSESGSAKEVAMSGRVLQAYRSVLEQYTGSLQRFCYERGIAYIRCVTSIPPADLLQGQLRLAGVLR